MTRQLALMMLLLTATSTTFAQANMGNTSASAAQQRSTIAQSPTAPRITVSTIDIKIQSSTGAISRILQPTGIAFEKNLNFPTNGMLYVTDEPNKKVYYINSFSTYGKLFATQVNHPYDILFSYNGRVEVTDNDRISEFTWSYGYVQPSYPILTTVVSPGYVNGNKFSSRFDNLRGIVRDPATNVIYLADYNNNRIRKLYNQTPINQVSITYAGNGNAAFADGPVANASFNGPTGIDIDSRGCVIVADKLNNRIRMISPTGQVRTIAGSGATGAANGQGTSATFNHPTDVAVDAQDNIYVADYDNNLIRKIDRAGTVSIYAGTGKPGNRDGIATEAEFNKPLSLTIDRATNTLYLTDYQNALVRKITVQ